MVFGLDDLAVMGIAASAMSAGSNIFGGLLGQSGAQATNDATMRFNSYQSQLNREFQERMSSTAYVRAMTDMRNAGLNPILAANVGGASTPGGSEASVSGLANPGALLGQGISSAGQAGQRFADFKATMTQAQKDASQVPVNATIEKVNSSQEALNKGLEIKAGMDAGNSAAQTAYYTAATDTQNQEAKNKAVQNSILASDAVTARARAQIEELKAQGSKDFGPNKVGGVVTDISRIGRTIVEGIDDQVRRHAPGQPTPSPNPRQPGTFQVSPYQVPGFGMEQYRR